MIYGYIFNKPISTDPTSPPLPLNIPSLKKQAKEIRAKYPQISLITTNTYLSDIDLPSKIKAKDMIVIYSVTILGKTCNEVMNCYNKLITDKIDVESISEPFANSSIFKDVYEKTKQEIQASGQTQKVQTVGLGYYLQEMLKIAYTTATSKKKSGPKPQGKQEESERAKKIKAQILKYSRKFNGQLTDNLCMRAIGVAKNTFYKYKKQLEAELDKK